MKQPGQSEVQSLINLLNSGQLPQAVATARDLLKRYPKVLVLHSVLGNSLIGQRKFEQAEKSLSKVVSLKPDSLEAWSALGYAQEQQGRFEEAIRSYRKALALDPRIPELHFNVGVLQAGLEKLEPAIASYRKAIELNPGLVDAHYNLGSCLQSRHDHTGAAECYRRAIAIEPGFFEAHGNLGTVLQEQGSLQDAIDCYRQALVIKPDAQLYYNLGTALKNAGRLDEALESYQQALSIKDDYADAYSNIAEVLRDQGRYAEAVECFQQALKINPDLPSANYSLGIYLYDSGDLEGALEHFERSQMADWQERSLYCLYKTGHFEAFKQRLDELIDKRHTSPFLATLVGHYAENFGVENRYGFCPKAMDFVFHYPIEELKGENNELLQALLRDINFADIGKKMQGRLVNGIQSSGNLFHRPEESFRTLAKVMMRVLGVYRDYFKDDDCTYVREFPQEIEFASSWYVKMKSGGHLRTHIHEDGWVSGAIYLALPQNKVHPNEGSIEVSTHGDDYPKLHDNFAAKTIAPEVGDTVLFPSSLFHRTIPFSSDEERICIAFDLKPREDLIYLSMPAQK